MAYIVRKYCYITGPELVAELQPLGVVGLIEYGDSYPPRLPVMNGEVEDKISFKLLGDTSFKIGESNRYFAVYDMPDSKPRVIAQLQQHTAWQDD